MVFWSNVLIHGIKIHFLEIKSLRLYLIKSIQDLNQIQKEHARGCCKVNDDLKGIRSLRVFSLQPFVTFQSTRCSIN